MKTVLAVSSMAALLALTGCSAPAEVPNKQAESPKGQTFNAVVNDDELTKMFRWWNEAYTKSDGFTAEAFGQYFTEDTIMRINGRVSARGLDELASNFRKIQASTDMVKINLPFLDSFSSPDGTKIYTFHTVDALANGKPSQEMVTGYAEIRGGKIAVINFLNKDGQPESADK